MKYICTILGSRSIGPFVIEAESKEDAKRISLEKYAPQDPLTVVAKTQEEFISEWDFFFKQNEKANQKILKPDQETSEHCDEAAQFLRRSGA